MISQTTNELVRDRELVGASRGGGLMLYFIRGKRHATITPAHTENGIIKADTISE